MASQVPDLLTAVSALESFTGNKLTSRVAALEASFAGSSALEAAQRLGDAAVTHDLLASAYLLKRVAGQINVVIHVVGILLCLPHLLDPSEQVEYLSLGRATPGRRSISKPTCESRSSNSSIGRVAPK
jgi:hypothetical protein